MKIKASVFDVPYKVPVNVECGVLGSAILTGVGLGLFDGIEAAAAKLVRYEKDVLPDPRWTEVYRRMFPVFEKLYAESRPFYAMLDDLTADLETLNG